MIPLYVCVYEREMERVLHVYVYAFQFFFHVYLPHSIIKSENPYYDLWKYSPILANKTKKKITLSAAINNQLHACALLHFCPTFAETITRLEYRIKYSSHPLSKYIPPLLCFLSVCLFVVVAFYSR